MEEADDKRVSLPGSREPRLIRVGDQHSTPWKNGGGETVEIAVHPCGAGLSDFDWRISRAVVAQDGPFSMFEGLDRTLCVLEGESLALDFAGGDAVELTPSSAPFAFAGDAAVTARLGGGAITDLNVMTRRGAWWHSVVRLNAAADLQVAAETRSLAIIVWGGGADIAFTGYDMRLEPGDAAIADAPFAAIHVAPSAGACAFVVQLAGSGRS